MTSYEPYGARHFLRRRIPRAPPSCAGGSTTCATARCSTRASRRTSTGSGSTASSPTGRSSCGGGRRRAVRPRSTGSSGAGGTTRSGSVPSRAGRRFSSTSSLGDATQAAAVPRCADVLRLARKAGASGYLVTATRPQAIPRRHAVTVRDGLGEHHARRRRAATPPGWLATGSGGRRSRSRARSRREAGGVELAGALHRPRNGRARSGPAPRRAQLRHGGLHPGSGGPPLSFGPLTLSRAVGRSVQTLAPSAAHTLCGRRLDWIKRLVALDAA